MKFSLIILLMFFFSGISVHSTVRYVSKSGKSIPPYTSWLSACDSIGRVINYSNPGDTIYVANGVYKETLVINKTLTMIGESMDSTVIDARGLRGIIEANRMIDVLGDLTIRNFHFYCDRYFPSSMVISLYYNITIDNCFFDDVYTGVGVTAADLKATNLIIKCGDGVGIFSNSFTNNSSYIHNCIVIGGFHSVDVIYIPKLTITNSLFYRGEVGSGSRLEIKDVKNALIANNVVDQAYENAYGLSLLSVGEKAEVLNNVFLSASNRSGLSVCDTGRTIVKNNIIMHNRTRGISLIGNYKYDYNLFYDNGVNFWPGGKYGAHDIVADPMIAADSAKSIYSDFHLQKYSPAIDAGDPSILDKDGSRSDIGLYGGPYGESYSYKDLSPRAPSGLNIKVIDSVTVELKWNKNTERDTSEYLIYADTKPGLTGTSLQLTNTTAKNSYTYHMGRERKCYFRLRAKDRQGNLSDLSSETGIDITSVENPVLTPEGYTLYPNYPNPFNPETVIAYNLKETGKVRLTVYDIKGEIVRTLQNSEQAKGYHEVRFNAEGLSSGIYLYRIEVIGKGGIPQYSDMRKMVYLK